MKKIFIALIVLTMLVFTASTIGCSCGKSDAQTANPQSTSETAGTIQIPEGPKIKVIFNGPPELKAKWEELGLTGFQLKITGTITNVASQTVKYSEIGFLLDGTQVSFLPGKTLAPGETTNIATGFAGYSESTKEVEIKVKGLEKVNTPSQPAETSSAPVTNGLAKPPDAETPVVQPDLVLTFTDAPKNPSDPAQAAAAFFFLWNKGEFAEAEKYASERLLRKFNEKGGLEKLQAQFFGGRKLDKVELSGFWQKESKAIITNLILSYSDGSKNEQLEVGADVYFEDGRWKFDGG